MTDAPRGHADRLPVLMLHSVAPAGALTPHAWLARLSVDPRLLELTFDLWRRKGYRTLASDELEGFLAGSRRVPRGSLALTLDDGYVDNWTVLHPMLESFGFHAIIFVSTDFVDPRPVTRPAVRLGELPSGTDLKGYLSWDEMRLMKEKGTAEIQSHATTHTWHFVSRRIVDYYRPEIALTKGRSRLRFLWLNRYPGRKPFCLQEMADDVVRWGTPVYEFAPSLVARRYFPDPKEEELICGHVDERGGAGFFDTLGWREELDRVVAGFRRDRGERGARETESETRARQLAELETSRRTLGARLDTDVSFLSFPQGAMDAALEDMAREVGYRLWTMSSREHRFTNPFGAGVGRVYRCGSCYGLFGESATDRSRLASHHLLLKRHMGSLSARILSGALAFGGRWKTSLGAG